MAITDKLQKLYLKMGGDPNTGASNVEEWIDKIEDVAGSGGSGTGGGVLIVTDTVTIVPPKPGYDLSSEQHVLDKNWAEIEQAVNSGLNVVIRRHTSNDYDNAVEDITVTGFVTEIAQVINTPTSDDTEGSEVYGVSVTLNRTQLNFMSSSKTDPLMYTVS